MLIVFGFNLRNLGMSLIIAENSKAGSHDWQLTRMRLDKNEGVLRGIAQGSR